MNLKFRNSAMKLPNKELEQNPLSGDQKIGSESKS